MIRARVTGQKSLRARLRNLAELQRAALRDAAADGLADVQREARRSLRRATNPALGTGALARSLTVRLDADGLGGSVGTDLPHGRYLEFGTRKMAARPWLQPAFEAVKPRLRQRLARAVKSANRQAAGRRTASESGPEDAGRGA